MAAIGTERRRSVYAGQHSHEPLREATGIMFFHAASYNVVLYLVSRLVEYSTVLANELCKGEQTMSTIPMTSVRNSVLRLSLWVVISLYSNVTSAWNAESTSFVVCYGVGALSS